MSSAVSRRKLPWWKKLLFSLVATVLFFGLLELVLALVGVKPLSELEDPFAGFSARIPHFDEIEGTDGVSLVRLAETKRRHFHDLEFLAQKKDGVQRVFCVGGSTTYGRPFWDETSFSGWLRALLDAEGPAQRWEILNAGGISYASYRVVGVMRELAAFDPDVFVVYVGQNEFLEYRTYKDLIDDAGMAQDASALLSKTRLATVVHDLVSQGSRSGHSAKELPDLRAVNSVGPEAYVRDEPTAARIVTHFKLALDEMIKIAEGAGARILFVVPASNLADFAPFKSALRDGVTPEDHERFEVERYRAKAAARAKQWKVALRHLKKAEAVDARHAGMLYVTGQALRALGRSEEAAAYFRRAKDEDIVPLRAISQIGDALRTVGRRPDVGLVDFEALASSRAEVGVPGDGEFADHVHPKVATNGALAEKIAAWLLGREPKPESIAYATERVGGAIEGPRYARELLKLSRMLEAFDQDEAALNRVEEALALAPGNLDVEMRLAGLELKHGRHALALTRFRRLTEAKPESAAAHAGLGAAHVAEDRADLARLHLERSIELDPVAPYAREQLGVICAMDGKFEAAIEHFRVALRASPASAQAHSNLGLAYAKAGDTGKAEACYRAALELDPTFVSALYNYALLLEDSNRKEQALERLKAALRADRGHVGARKALLRLGYRVQ